MTRGRKRFLLILLLAALALLAYQGRSGPLRPASFLRAPVDYLSGAVYSVFDSLESFFGRFSSRGGGLAGLGEENSRLRLENMRLRESERENIRLRELLGLKEMLATSVVAARVIRRNIDPWIKEVVIDKGTDDGVHKDMAVLAPEGLAGVVREAGRSHSTVMLINDSRFRASARAETNRTEGIVAGTGGRECRLLYVGEREPLGEGETIITSGLDGVFPRGINIGYAREVSGVQGELFKDASVAPFVNPDNIEEVILVK